ncbi:glycosyltransferase [Streptomyces sp. MS06]|uniref:glycosyltransferase n=1 Tax=Streptomyces sp. MS06 TaxID=3385974 RepID=UPI0039A34A29
MPRTGSTASGLVPAVGVPRPRSAGSGAGRIAIVSASVGAGHDGAAAELALRLAAEGFAVDRFDLLDLLPARLGRVVQEGYHRMLVRAPWAYQRIYAGTERAGGVGPASRALLRAAEEPVLRALSPGTGAVVSTYPGASRVLGALRLKGRLAAPVLTYLTDFSVHPLWVADGVDVHLAAHDVPAGQARAAGARDVRVCGPVTGSRFRPCGTQRRARARAAFGLPPDAPLALLVAGSWGVGQVREVAVELRDCGVAVPVVVCGRNRALAERLRAEGIAHVYGWVDDMPGLMHACDVLVQNAGGLTSLEAFAAGLPVASFRCIPGHGLTNAAALEEAGVATWIRDPAALGAVLRELVDGPLGRRQRARGLALFARPGDGGPAAEIARVHRSGPVRRSRPPTARQRPRPRVRPLPHRLAATAAVASAVWAGAVGTGVATSYDGADLIHAIGHGLDPDDPAPLHAPHPGDRHS